MSGFDEEFKKILEEFGFPMELLKDFFVPSYIPRKPWISTTEKDRIHYDVLDRDKFLEVVIELPIQTKARKLEDLEYMVHHNVFLVKDKISDKSVITVLPCYVKDKPIEKPTYVNRVFDIKLKKIESYNIPVE
jgi:hypothetical protein